MRIVRFIGTFIGNTAGGRCFPDSNDTMLCYICILVRRIFLAAYAIDQLGKKLLGREDQYELNQQFVGYSMVVTFCARYCQWVVLYFHSPLDIAILYYIRGVRGCAYPDEGK